jgi:hypothetical protein
MTTTEVPAAEQLAEKLETAVVQGLKGKRQLFM